MSIIVVLFILFVACVPASAQNCRASWYGAESGHVTASGARFHPSGLSIALRSHHFGDHYRVSYRGRSVIAVHNDWGPALWTKRCVDLSRGVKVALRFPGLGMVRLKRV